MLGLLPLTLLLVFAVTCVAILTPPIGWVFLPLCGVWLWLRLGASGNEWARALERTLVPVVISLGIMSCFNFLFFFLTLRQDWLWASWPIFLTIHAMLMTLFNLEYFPWPTWLSLAVILILLVWSSSVLRIRLVRPFIRVQSELSKVLTVLTILLSCTFSAEAQFSFFNATIHQKNLEKFRVNNSEIKFSLSREKKFDRDFLSAKLVQQAVSSMDSYTKARLHEIIMEVSRRPSVVY